MRALFIRLSKVDRRNRPAGRRIGLLPFVVVALVSLEVLGPPAVAAADPPVREEFTVVLSGPHFLSGFCGTPILQEGILHVSSTQFSDGRVIEHIRGDLQLSANGRLAFERPAFSVVVDPDDGTVTATGTLVNIHAPHGGLLLKDAGRIVRDLATGDILALAGRWMILEGELDEVCSYFAAAP